MKNILSLFFVLFVLFGSYAVAEENSEITFLLSFVADSDCIFIRNGNEYQGKKASKHLARKYDYAKSRVTTAEDFIGGIASRSSMTKKPYLVRCNGKEEPAEKWFTDALASYRAEVSKVGK